LIPKTILITGASGLIGSRLTELLLEKGYAVRHLGRTKKKDGVPTYVWDITRGFIEEGALESVDAIIHLAGAGIADEPWTAKRKQEILESRTHSTTLLFRTLKHTPHAVTSFVSASAIGYYGFARTDEVFTEDSRAGNDFLSDVVKKWEAEIDTIQEAGIRTVKIRIGIVLSEKGGALKEMAQPVRMFVGAPLGSGRQMMSWIHIDDLCRMFIFALENPSMQGAYNAVAPHWISNKELTQAIAKTISRPLILPNVPAFVLKFMLGEMASLILEGSKVSAAKIQATGFSYDFPEINSALQNLLQHDS
jgi:uncharacterized protein